MFCVLLVEESINIVLTREKYKAASFFVSKEFRNSYFVEGIKIKTIFIVITKKYKNNSLHYYCYITKIDFN